MEKHSAEWCKQNPCQSAADIERLHMAVKEALRLIRTDDPKARQPGTAEAMVWLHNASQI